MRIEYPHPGHPRLLSVAPGTTVYGLAFRYDKNKERIALKARPVRGQLCVCRYDDASEARYRALGDDTIRYFVPLAKSGQLAWSKAVRVESRCYADDVLDATDWYDAQVRAAAQWLRAKADEVEKELIRTNGTT